MRTKAHNETKAILQKRTLIYQQQKMKKMKVSYRIQNSDGTFLNAGTGLDSWFTLEKARNIVNYNIGQRIVESDGVNVLWEIF